MRRIIGFCAAALVVALALTTGAAGKASADVSRVPCAKLKKQHKQLPARCRKKKPPAPAPPPALGNVVATIAIPGETTQPTLGVYHDNGGLAFGEGSLWIADAHGLVRVDPATNAVVARIDGPSGGDGVVVTDGSVWYDSWDESAVYRVDPLTNSIVATIPVGGGASGMTVTPGSIWVASHYTWAVDRIDTATNAVVATIRMPGEQPNCCGPQEIAATPTGVWVGVPFTNQVVRIDPASNAVSAVISAGVSCGGLAADASAVWVTNGGCGGSSIARIDPTTNDVKFRGVIGDMILVTDAVIANGSVYFRVGSVTSGIERVDPATDKVTGTLEIPGLSADGTLFLAYGGGLLWVRSPGQVTRVQLSP